MLFIIHGTAGRDSHILSSEQNVNIAPGAAALFDGFKIPGTGTGIKIRDSCKQVCAAALAVCGIFSEWTARKSVCNNNVQRAVGTFTAGIHESAFCIAEIDTGHRFENLNLLPEVAFQSLWVIGTRQPTVNGIGVYLICLVWCVQKSI